MTKRTKLRCKNLAAYGCKVCRMYAAHKFKNVLRGATHPQYRNGEETLEAKAKRSPKSALFRCLIDIGNHCNMFYKQLKTRGRPPLRYAQLVLLGPNLFKEIQCLHRPKI